MLPLKWTKILLALPLLILIADCAVSLESPSPDACVWIKTIILDEGYETRLTRDEKEQILAHDLNVERNCK